MLLDTLIKEKYNSLTKTEKKIADKLLSNNIHADEYSLIELSKILNTGEATIIRFSRKLGFKGYQEFKLALSKEALENENTNFDNFVDKVGLSTKKIINDSVNEVDKANIVKAVKILNDSNRVLLFGVGVSGYSAKIAEQRFMRNGLHSHAVTDGHFQAMEASLLCKDDTVLAISNTGYSKDTIESVKIAKNVGAKIIALTSDTNSTLAKEADLVIQSFGKKEFLNGGSFGTCIAQLFILDMMCTAYSLIDKEYSVACMAKALMSISNKGNLS